MDKVEYNYTSISTGADDYTHLEMPVFSSLGSDKVHERPHKRVRMEAASASYGSFIPLPHDEIHTPTPADFEKLQDKAKSGYDSPVSVYTDIPPNSSLLAGYEEIDLSSLSNDDPILRQQVCFGMLKDIPIDLVHGTETARTMTASLDGSTVVADTGESVGRLSPKMVKILHFILEDKDCWLQIRCVIKLQHDQARTKRLLPAPQAFLLINLYGPLDMFHSIGDVLERNQLFLQEPTGCDRVVEYRNPHRLSGLDLVATMTKIEDLVPPVESEIAPSPVDLLGDFETTDSLPEAEQPAALKTQLHRHQKQGLTFMRLRESGWRLSESGRDVWSLDLHNNGQAPYINNVNGLRYHEAPEEFRGGIVADYMGLGKSLSMIALIASDLDMEHLSMMRTPSNMTGYEDVHSTLLIVPSTLIKSWENQFSTHIDPSILRWRTHHGKHRLQTSTDLMPFNVVITSFQTIAQEWKKLSRHPQFIFSVIWRRIVLDEAHYIKDVTSLTAKAVSAISAQRRWAVTGTPIQNNLNDLASLLQFLKVYPYSDRSAFDRDIAYPWKEQQSDLAISRLKKLLTYIMLRRSQATITLPPRHDIVQRLTFSPEERAVYDDARARTIRLLDQELLNGSPSKGSYMNALQRINALRMICNLGRTSRVAVQGSDLRQPKNTPSPPNIPLPMTSWTGAAAQEAFEDFVTVGQAVCSNCCVELETLGSETQLLTYEHRPPPVLTQCLYLWCGRCSNPSAAAGRKYHCGHTSPCPEAAISISQSFDDYDTKHDFEQLGLELPTKIRTLVTDLSKNEDTKSIIFSFWTSTFDIIAAALDQAGMGFVRYDGKVPQNKRAGVLDRFEKDSSTNILLLSVSCGAVGLNLTVASRAYLMEPHWNPTVEDQALARIHRLGQTREVHTIRYIMKDSFEEHVIKVQDRKKHLADLLLSKKHSSKDLAMSRFEHLRSLLG